MADIHLNTTGSATSPYDTWAKAATSWATAVAGMAAGDRLLVDAAFNTSVAGVALVFPGTPANPNQILSGTPAGGSGLSALSAGGKCTSSNTSFTVEGSFYAYGITWLHTSGSGTTIVFSKTDTNYQQHDTCAFESTGASSSTVFLLGTIAASSGSYLAARNCTFKFGAVAQAIQPAGKVDLLGCSVASGGTSPTSLLLFTGPSGSSRAVDVNMIGFDFSNCSVGVNVMGLTTAGGQHVMASDCKLPASWSGAYQTGTLMASNRNEFHNFDNGATGYKFNITDFAGTVDQNASIYVTGTTTDGVAISDKMVTNANVKFPNSLKGRWYYAYDAGAGSAKTATIQCARDGSATKFNDNEAWIEVECLGTASYPLGVLSNDRMDDMLATPAAQATGVGTGSWTGLSGTACSMALTASYTPRHAGYVRARVCLAAPSATLYVDPAVTLA